MNARLRLATLAFAVLATATGASAQVSCTNPDALCTGDPCVIPDLAVTTPCVVDFGARTLVVRGRVRVPDAGVLDFTAATIEVEPHGAVNGSYEISGGNGADIALRASGAIEMAGRLRASGGSAAGTITVEAGGTLVISGSVRANGRKLTAGGSVAFTGGGDVQILRFVEVSGGSGGIVTINSTAGAVLVGHQVRAIGDGTGGMVLIQAASDATVSAVIVTRGRGAGGVIAVTTLGDSIIDSTLRARSSGGTGGTIVVDAGGDALVPGNLDARGKLAGGSIQVSAAGQATLPRSADVDVRGNPGGSVHVEGAGVTIERAADVIGNSFGALRFAALSGDATLSGDFTTKSGTIEGTATGDLLADGRFSAGPVGCIALGAGGTLDTTSGLFDETIVPDCPGSPSGAFLDG